MIVRTRRALAIGAALAVAGCIELGGPKTGVVSITNLRLPYPSVVIGDLLRDSLGVPTPLSITAFGADGAVLLTEEISFLALDSTLSVGADGSVRGLLRDSLGGRVVASAGGLQTPAQRIIVTIAPTLAVKSAASTSIAFDNTKPDSTEKQNWSPALELTLTGASAAFAQGYVVNYELIETPAPKDAGIPTAYITDESNRRMPRDTTDTRGIASRRVVLRQSAVEDALRSGARSDTIVVLATVRYLGVDVPGSPITFIVPVFRKP
ncbi:MAG: hypothetical protein ABIR92_05460 [Gemmatimonadaceae bacterium]